MAKLLDRLCLRAYAFQSRLTRLFDFDPAKHPRYPANSVGGRGGEFLPIGRIGKEQLKREIEALEKAKVLEQQKLDQIRSRPRNPVTGNRAGIHQAEIARLDILIQRKQDELYKSIETLPPLLGKTLYGPKGRSFLPHARGPARKWYEVKKDKEHEHD